MGNEGSYTALGLKVWKAQVDRADKLFGTLSSEQILQEIAPGRNRLLYLWGHLTAIHDAMLPLLGLGKRSYPEFDVAFVINPDKSQTFTPSHEEIRRAWIAVNIELSKGFDKMSPSDWLQRHSAVSEEEFAKDPSRSRFSIAQPHKSSLLSPRPGGAWTQVIERKASELESFGSVTTEKGDD